MASLPSPVLSLRTLLLLFCLALVAITVVVPSYGKTVREGDSEAGPAVTESALSPSVIDSTSSHHNCTDNDNLCPRGCSPVNDSDCEMLRRVELMERFLKTHQKGDLYTPDPREALSTVNTEVYRLLYGSQALGYLDLYEATGKEPYLREATERLEALQASGNIWSDRAWDGDLALAFLRASEFTGDNELFETGITAARRLVTYCDQSGDHGACELNWGMSAALCLAEAYRLTGEDQFLAAARIILARTQFYQHDDGSLPHQSDLEARNLEYSSWVAFQLTNYLLFDPDATDAHITILHQRRKVTLDVELMLSRLISLLKERLAENGSVSYSSGWRLEVRVDPECVYCSNPVYQQCRFYCRQRCGGLDLQPPCACIEDATECRGDPVCLYCSDPMLLTCVDSCRVFCGSDFQFPCRCITDPQVNCPRDSTWREINYYDDRDPNYDTRGWTSELASTACALAKTGEHETKWKVLDFLFSLQNKDGTFPDKWGYKTEQPGTPLWLWASEEHSVIRTSIIFRVLSSLLVSSGGVVIPKGIVASSGGSVVELPASPREARLNYSPRMSEVTPIFPNPSHGGVTLRFALPSDAVHVELVIVDIAGRTVKSLGNLGPDGPGSQVTWDGTDDDGRRVAPGVYFAQVVGEGLRCTKKLVILGGR